MSIGVLDKALGVRGSVHQSIRVQEGGVLIRMQHDGSSLDCPQCEGANVIRRGTVPRSWSAPPIGTRSVTLFADVPRIACRDCHTQPVSPVPFADSRRSYTHSFRRLVLSLRKSMTIQDVADHLQVSHWLVRAMEKRWLGKHFSRPKLKHLRRIAMDEISTKKGHVSLTIVLDLESGTVVFVGPGKGAKALIPFWKRLRSSEAKVKAVARDMSTASIPAVSEHLPKAAIVFDWFHIVKLLNDKLSQLRRELHREATDKLHQQVLKGTRWLLLKRPEHLDETKREHRRLQDALKLNSSLATAYYLKEDLRELWEQPPKETADRFLSSWIKDAMDRGIRMLPTFAATRAGYRSGLLAWYDHPISTGPLEGTNNKTKTMKRQAYGYRDQEYFALKILALHHSKWKLIG